MAYFLTLFIIVYCINKQQCFNEAILFTYNETPISTNFHSPQFEFVAFEFNLMTSGSCESDGQTHARKRFMCYIIKWIFFSKASLFSCKKNYLIYRAIALSNLYLKEIFAIYFDLCGLWNFLIPIFM